MNGSGWLNLRDMMVRYNPDAQTTLCTDIYDCIFGNHPTLAELKRQHGDKATVAWLVPQLFDLSEFCGSKGKISDRQMEQCAAIIVNTYYYLKTTELMLFFYRFKQGRYGKFYGAVDPLVITTSVRDFIVERNDEYFYYEQKIREEKEREQMKNTITYQEYLEMEAICEQIEAEYYMPTKWNQ